MREIFRFARQHRIAVPYIICATPYPKTQFGEDLLREGLVSDPDNYDLFNCWATNVRTRHMSRLRLSFERSLGFVRFGFRTAVLGDHYYVRKLRKEHYLWMIYYRVTSMVYFVRLLTGGWQYIHGTSFYSWRDWPCAVRDAVKGTWRKLFPSKCPRQADRASFEET